jgi:hypothetical protein
VVPLIDMLKEAVLRTGCLRGVTSVADRGNLAEDVLAECLLLAIYAYGTNTASASSPWARTATARTISVTRGAAT